jgi:membrane protease subunit HflC
MNDEIFSKKVIRNLIIATAFFVLLTSTIFTVDQRQQALVLQFGEPIRLIQSAGLKFKMPFVQNVIYFDKRLLDFGFEFAPNYWGSEFE